MQEIVINRCFGGFNLSREACEFMGLDPDGDHSDIARDDSNLVECVRMLGERASGPYAKLTIVEIPDGVDWRIEEYDGNEHIAEAHRTWY